MKRDLLVVGAGNMGGGLVRNFCRLGLMPAVMEPKIATIERLLNDPEVRGRAEVFPTAAVALANLKRPASIFACLPHAHIEGLAKELAQAGLTDRDALFDASNAPWARTLASKGFGLASYADLPLSGGPTGALEGPTVMFGGREELWQRHRALLCKMAARARDGSPCAARIGPLGSAQFLKCGVHNPAEYGVMQGLADAFVVCKALLNMDGRQFGELLASARTRPELDTYLCAIAVDVVQQCHPDKPDCLLIDEIVDQAESNGTGLWGAEESLRIGSHFSSVVDAVQARGLSKDLPLRQDLSALFPVAESHSGRSRDELAGWVLEALSATVLLTHAQAFHLLRRAGHEYGRDHGWSFDLAQVAAIFRGGCILQGRLMEKIAEIFRTEPDLHSLIRHPWFAQRLAKALPAWRDLTAECVRCHVPAPGCGGMLQHLDSARRGGAQNLVQALRDRFGWHGFRLRDREGLWHLTWERPVRELVRVG